MRSLLLLAVLSVAPCVLGWEGYITMRDGTKLHTAVDFPLWSTAMGEAPPDPSFPLKALAAGAPAPRRSMPQEGKKYTLVMDRSPYGQFGIELLADIYLLLGYVAVRQDMRGTHLSEGNFTVWHNAANDSYDTMKYLTSQSWSDGEVYTIGASADGIASFCEVLDQPVWLKKQFIIFATSRGRDVMFPGGAYRMALIDFWLEKTVPKQSSRVMHEVQMNEGPGPWWNAVNDTGQYYKVNFPSVMWGGWYDIFLNGNLAGFDGYQHHSSYKGHSKLVIDPLGHCQDGHKYFPHNLIEGRAILPILLSWDLYKNYTAAEGVKDVTFYVMGSYNEKDAPGNYWTTLDAWPQYKATSWFLHSDGTLQTSQPTEPHSNQTYTYDPSNPVPTEGGNNLELKCGPLDQSEAEKRPDVLTFTTPELTEHMAVTGPLSATLYVSSSAKDTDFTAKLTDVYPDGTSRLIQDGIVRMRWRNNRHTAANITAGTVYEIEVGMWNTSFVFNKGHRVRLSVSSSNSPRFNPNPNTGLPLVLNGTVAPVVARNTLHHSAAHPSKLVLPVVSLLQMPPHFVLDQELAMLRTALDTDTQGAMQAHRAISQRVLKSVLA